MTIEQINALSAKVPKPEAEYVGENGLMCCAACHKQVQTEIEIFGQKRVVRCICDCRKKEIEAEKEQQARLKREHRRNVCFAGAKAKVKAWTFEKDDARNPKLSEAAKNYVKNFNDFKKDGKGLLFHGTVGTGKTFYAASIANALIDEGYKVLMTNFSRMTNELQGTFEKQAYIDDLNNYTLLIIDDLGVERTSDYVKEIVYNIIDSRYSSGLPLIITTNLTMDEIKKPQEIGYSRIYDRILEMCFPIEVNGNSRRRQNVRDSYYSIKEKLGL